jgi:tetratricopeptide (TPR) repeat protein
MKNKMLLLVILAFSVSVFAQKKELKVAEKSFKKKEYVATLDQLKVVEPLLAEANDKLKEKYFYLKAESFYNRAKKIKPANAKSKGKNKKNKKTKVVVEDDTKNIKNLEAAGLAYQELIAFEKKAELKKYLKQAESNLSKVVQRFANLGSRQYKEKEYKEAGSQFEMVYAFSKRDTSYLDNAALCAFYTKDYDRSIQFYKELLGLGYTGISTQYRAKSTINDDYMYFGSKKEMDKQVIMKTVTQPEVYQTESRTGDIAKNIALSYIAKGDKQAALDAIAEAKKSFPNDYTLVISEANIYYKLGNNEKFLAGLKEAIAIKPNDAQLYYNVGVLTLEQGYGEEAIKAFTKATELRPDFADAYSNIGVAILERTKPIVDEMNENLSNFKKYDALNIIQKEVYKDALPFFEKALELKPKNDSTLTTLLGLYELLEMYDKQKATKARLDVL